MDVLVVGYSNIASRRVLPALDALDACGAVDVASRRPLAPSDVASRKLRRVFTDARGAIAESSAPLVYVSTENDLHEALVMHALECGKHVVVDKPAMLTRAAVEGAASVARAKGLCFAEAVVYPFHAQAARVRAIFDAEGCAPSRVVATLTFPPLDPGNIRYRKAHGGGAYWDLGPYAVSVGRVVFGAPMERCSASVNGVGGPDGVDTAFSLLAEYGGGRTVVGHFGMDTEYDNGVVVLGAHVSVKVQRFFTTTPDAPAELAVRVRNQVTTERIAPDDTFRAFLAAVMQAIASGASATFIDRAAADAADMARLRTALGLPPEARDAT